MKIVTFSTLFPNAAQPHHGVFVENRLRHLLASGAVTARVIAPVPWFPCESRHFPAYSAFARAPRHEVRHGVMIDHPRYAQLPRVGMTLAPALLYLGAWRAFRALQESGEDFDLIDAHYFYPDGVAAAMLARRLKKPFTITARGTDINLIPAYALPRRMILKAAAAADGLITVCQALKDEMTHLGVAADRITVLRNGVDLVMFRPGDRARFRAALDLSGPTLLSVGLLIPRKGHDLVIRALADLPGYTLLIAGDGPDGEALGSVAAAAGVADRVRFLGRVAHDQLPCLYGAADALVLASSREGWANVLLEAMACGTPVIASNVWGTPEVVSVPEAGVLMTERTASGVADGVRRLFAALPDRHATRAYAEQFSWDATTQGQIELFRSILARRAGT
ncbi:MAG: glycosyltransferase family 4 protein [Alphaproteobacteria bacterium]